jgi:hypothetical protein
MSFILFFLSNINFMLVYMYMLIQYIMGIYFGATCFVIIFKVPNPEISFIIASLISSFMFLYTCIALEYVLEILYLEFKRRYQFFKIKQIENLKK